MVKCPSPRDLESSVYIFKSNRYTLSSSSSESAAHSVPYIIFLHENPADYFWWNKALKISLAIYIKAVDCTTIILTLFLNRLSMHILFLDLLQEMFWKECILAFHKLYEVIL